MRKIIFILLICTQVTFAQQANEVLFTIDNEKVFLDEFERVYTKNNMNNQADYSKASLEEYLELFTNFKLKVKEAKALQMDTIPSIKAELESYKRQLIKSYIHDKEVSDELVKEAYDRSTKEIDVSHILVRWPNEYPSKADSAQTLAKINTLKKGLTPKNFAETAVKKSEDPSAKDNRGRLGYLSAFQTVYPFETAMYSTAKGEISEPAATRFGYHLVLVHDVRAARGKIETAHILFKSKASDAPELQAAARKQAQQVYADITNKTINFEGAVSKFSDDRKTKQNGGKLPLLSSAEMLTSYADAAFSLENDGDITAPVKTVIGWHIIKRIRKESVLPFDKSKNALELKVAKDSRSNVAFQKNIEDSKQQFGFSQNQKNVDETIKALKNAYKNGNFTIDKLEEKELFKIGYAPFTNNSFIAYAKRSAKKIKDAKNVENILRKQYKSFQDARIEKYREKNLAQINEDYKNLLQEYNDGILLFELTNNEVWNKAVEDTAGLKAFFNANRGNYMWSDRIDYDKFVFMNETAAAKGIKLLEKGKAADVVLKKLNKKEELLSQKNSKEEKAALSVKNLAWKKGSTLESVENGKTVLYRVNALLDPMPKALNETKGYVISDFQNELEKEWIKTLRAKYTVELNEALFNSLIK